MKNTKLQTGKVSKIVQIDSNFKDSNGFEGYRDEVVINNFPKFLTEKTGLAIAQKLDELIAATKAKKDFDTVLWTDDSGEFFTQIIVKEEDGISMKFVDPKTGLGVEPGNGARPIGIVQPTLMEKE